MATKLTKKQKELLTDKITGMIRNSPALRMTLDSSVNELNINQISGELNRIHYRAIGKDLPAVITFAPKQAGSGDPSPTNIRPISGYEITGIGTVYGGELNIETGVLTVSYDIFTMRSSQSVTNNIATQNRVYFRLDTMLSGSYINDPNVVCNSMPKSTPESSGITIPCIAIGANNQYIYVQGITFIPGVSDIVTFREWLDSEPLIFSYKLQTPETYTLTPQQMLELLDQL